MGGADRRGEAGFGAQRIAAGDKGEIVGAAAQFVDEVGDQIVEPAVLADHGGRAPRAARVLAEAKMAASTRSIHSRQRAAGGRSASSTSRLSSLLSPAAARRGAHRPYSRNVGRPENSRAAPSATSRSNSRRAARPVIGAWRAASAGETQSSASRRSTIFGRRFRPQFGRDGDQGFGAAGKIGGEVEGGGGGERDRARGGVWPGGLVRPCASPSPVGS